ncbi:MAG: redoxin domain-containing protein [Opitutaceae bacterium]|nr:redoxin domain-containing protein [Opitutaceae bacterium]
MNTLLSSFALRTGSWLTLWFVLAGFVPMMSGQSRYVAGDLVQPFSLTNRADGKPVSLNDFEGKVVFLEWFAWWCPFCQAAASQIEPGIAAYYRTRNGNLNGVPVIHVSVNLQSGQEAQTQDFVNRYGLGLVLNDFNRGLADRFHAGGQPLFAIINGVAGSPSHRQWELIYTQQGYGQLQFPIETFRQAIDSVKAAAVSAPKILTQPASQAVPIGSPASFSVVVEASAGTPTFQWRLHGIDLAGATAATLLVSNTQPSQAGLYSVVVTQAGNSIESAPAVLALSSSAKLVGSGQEFPDILHPSGTTYDQILLAGTAATITADPGQVTRLSYIDLNDDIVQVEFAGAGALTITLDGATGPSLPLKYNQGTAYMKGHARLTLAGTTADTFLSVFSVGRSNAVNQALFKEGELYDGVADLAVLGVVSPAGRLGGVRLANTELFASRGFAGILASGVRIGGPLNLHNLTALEEALPILISGPIDSGQIFLTGGDLLQSNGRTIEFGNAQRVVMSAGTTSHGVFQPAQANRGRLLRGGVDVTQEVVQNP